MSNLIDWMENTADQVPGASAVLDRAVYELKRLMEENEKLVKVLEVRLATRAVPEGWRLVPETPTWDMRQAFHDSYAAWEDGEGVCPDDQWSAMLAVTPRAPEECQRELPRNQNCELVAVPRAESGE